MQRGVVIAFAAGLEALAGLAWLGLGDAVAPGPAYRLAPLVAGFILVAAVAAAWLVASARTARTYAAGCVVALAGAASSIAFLATAIHYKRDTDQFPATLFAAYGFAAAVLATFAGASHVVPRRRRT